MDEILRNIMYRTAETTDDSTMSGRGGVCGGVKVCVDEILRIIMYRTAETTDDSTMSGCGGVWRS